MSALRIAPSVLACDFGRLAEEVSLAGRAGADWIHIDVMDGHFVPNLTLGPPLLPAIAAATDLPLDVHLMIERPELSLAAYAKAGAKRIGVHAETCAHLHRTLQEIRALGCARCVVLNPATPAEAALPVLDCVDQILVMSVNPGFGGQQFIDAVLPKCERLRRAIESCGRKIALQIDGGITAQTIGRAARAGCDTFVAGTAVFGARRPGESAAQTLPRYRGAIARLREAAAAG